LVATATAITVESIARAYGDFILKKKLPLAGIYFSGGGSRNKFLMNCLRRRLSGIGISKVEDLGVDGRYLEATAFAYFGFLALLGCPLGGPWTGVSGWAPPAHIIPGRNWPQIVRRIAAAKI
jgi:anhydro-N-acetylmuramic acid kinase